MKHANRIGRLGVLAVGLGIGAAVASTGTASADDFQISIDGFDLFSTANNTATAVSGPGDIAIAFGAGSDAVAEGGFGDFASADSPGATALAGDEAAGATGNDFDSASATGNGSIVVAGDGDGGVPDTTGASFDFASADGAGSEVVAGGNGSFDSASAVGNNLGATAGLSTNPAEPANFDSASILGFGGNAVAGGGVNGLGGSGDAAFVFEPLGLQVSDATAGLGSSFDVAGALGEGLNATATGANFLFDILP
jgi:hypothetical protein